MNQLNELDKNVHILREDKKLVCHQVEISIHYSVPKFVRIVTLNAKDFKSNKVDN